MLVIGGIRSYSHHRSVTEPSVQLYKKGVKCHVMFDALTMPANPRMCTALTTFIWNTGEIK